MFYSSLSSLLDCAHVFTVDRINQDTGVGSFLGGAVYLVNISSLATKTLVDDKKCSYAYQVAGSNFDIQCKGAFIYVTV